MIGQDPRDIEQAFRRMTKFHFWQPGTIAMTAISAIEQAESIKKCRTRNAGEN
ncbi:hypothetical protein [Citrobacter portucalensis]|uniref:hypothetical protein n=1 Tax=Citrobacter portucalensis TaxID=1639133 RepID=UPI003978C5B7